MRSGVLLLCVIAACSDSAPGPKTAPRARPVVYVVNYPLRYFAERIGGDRVEVRFPARADEDPAFWKPADDDVAAYQGADLILLNGAGYAGWVGQVSLPDARCVDTSAAYGDRLIEVEEAVKHAHGPTGDHEHGGVAFTTWLDFSLAAEQAGAVRDALSRLAPEHKAGFEERCAALVRDLEEIDGRLAALGRKAPLVGSHPVYQYLARRYGLNMKAVHWEPDEVPDRQGWEELKALLIDHPARWMIWEGEPLAETVKGLEALGVGSVVFDPCGNAPEKGDFAGVMRVNVDNLARALSGD